MTDSRWEIVETGGHANGGLSGPAASHTHPLSSPRPKLSPLLRDELAPWGFSTLCCLPSATLETHLSHVKGKKLGLVSRQTHLDISDKELRWRLHRSLRVNDLLDGAGPVHGLVEVPGVQPVTVLSPINGDVPEA